MNAQHHNEALCAFPIIEDPAVKRSSSELDLAAFLAENDKNEEVEIRVSYGSGFVEGYQQQIGSGFVEPIPVMEDALSYYFNHHPHQDIMKGFEELVESSTWHKSLTSSPPYCVSAMDSQSSMCGGSPTSTLKPKAGGSASSDDDIEEAGPCEQSHLPHSDKRLRRKISNKESARRSRKRKQAHLQELETQFELLSGENVNLMKQLGDAAQRLQHASTDNRVLKSDVEALRAKVKLAEDKMTRGSISPNLSQILETQLMSQSQMVNPQTFSRLGAMSPSVVAGELDGGSFFEVYSGTMPTSDNGSEGINNINEMLVGSCGTQMWH